MIGMGNDGRRRHFLAERCCGIVFAALKLVTNHGHFQLPVLFPQEEVTHAVRLELYREFKMIAGQVLVVVRPIEPRRGIVDTADPVHHRVESPPVLGFEIL